MKRYRIYFSSSFTRDLKKFKRDKKTVELIKKTLNELSINPFKNKLLTHQVNIPSLGKVWSSSITGDLRIIWNLASDERLVIIMYRVQGHDTVYR